MASVATVRAGPARVPAGCAPGLLRWVCTSNPFYVLSAGLFLVGLRVSFGAQAQLEDSWALMVGLATYTLLLAGTAYLLVRFGNVWDDVRTVLLLVVLMFLATSVTFDEVLVLNPRQGYVCYLGGLLLAVAVSEGLLRGIRLALPGWFRASYYLILALFFLYPLALRPLLDQPRSETLLWALFGFSPAAGLVFLTLWPAIRRGPEYVRANGSPWSWPLYPWVLFGLLGAAVPARAFLLCWSMHLLPGNARDQLLFGPYFLVPFGLAVALLLLEIGLVSARRGVLWTALAMPAALATLTLVGHRPDPIYQEFLETFKARLGGDPLFLTLLLSAAFYVYAALRRVPLAFEGLTVVLAALTVVGPEGLRLGDSMQTRPVFLLAAAELQLLKGLWRRQDWRCLLGAGGLVAAVVLAMPAGSGDLSVRGILTYHLVVAAVLFVGAAFDTHLGRFLRVTGAGLVLLASLAVLFAPLHLPASVPPGGIAAYPLILAGLLAGYGLLLGDRLSVKMAALVLSCWLAAAGWRGYSGLREIVRGLDYLAVSLVLFALAILVSLGKSGLLTRWLAAWGRRLPRT